MDEKLYRKIRIVNTWFIVVLMLGLFFCYYIPWLSVDQNYHPADDNLYFNSNMMKKSLDENIQGVSEKIDLLIISMWMILIFALFSQLGLSIYTSPDYDTIGLLFILSGSIITVISSFLAFIFNYMIINEIQSVSSSVSPSYFLPGFNYYYLPLLSIILLMIFSVYYTLLVAPSCFTHLKKIDVEEDDKIWKKAAESQKHKHLPDSPDAEILSQPSKDIKLPAGFQSNDLGNREEKRKGFFDDENSLKSKNIQKNNFGKKEEKGKGFFDDENDFISSNKDVKSNNFGNKASLKKEKIDDNKSLIDEGKPFFGAGDLNEEEKKEGFKASGLKERELKSKEEKTGKNDFLVDDNSVEPEDKDEYVEFIEEDDEEKDSGFGFKEQNNDRKGIEIQNPMDDILKEKKQVDWEQKEASVWNKSSKKDELDQPKQKDIKQDIGQNKEEKINIQQRNVSIFGDANEDKKSDENDYKQNTSQDEDLSDEEINKGIEANGSFEKAFLSKFQKRLSERKKEGNVSDTVEQKEEAIVNKEEEPKEEKPETSEGKTSFSKEQAKSEFIKFLEESRENIKNEGGNLNQPQKEVQEEKSVFNSSSQTVQEEVSEKPDVESEIEKVEQQVDETIDTKVDDSLTKEEIIPQEITGEEEVEETEDIDVLNVRCPKCKNEFEVENSPGDVIQIKCPHCGETGVIKKQK